MRPGAACPASPTSASARSAAFPGGRVLGRPTVDVGEYPLGRAPAGVPGRRWCGPRDEHGPGVGAVKRAEDAQQRGLARAARAEQGDELAALDVEVQLVEYPPAAELPAQSLDVHRESRVTRRAARLGRHGISSRSAPLTIRSRTGRGARRAGRRPSGCRSASTSGLAMRKPMPVVVLISSAAISAITLSVMDSRRPESSEGSAPGSTTSRTSAHRPSPNVRIASTSCGSTLRTPPAVETYIGNVVATAIRTTRAASPIPNQTMNSGTSDRNGSARKELHGESSSSSPSRENPVITPRASRRTTPNSKPGAARRRETPDRGLELPALPELPGGAGDLLRARRARPGSAPRWRCRPPGRRAARAGRRPGALTDTPGRRGLSS